MAKPVGEVLRSIREDAGLSRSAVARRAKMEPGALLRVENGSAPSFALVIRVARALGVSLDAIADASYGRAPRPKPQAADTALAEALGKLEATLNDAAEIVNAIRDGRSVSPPRRRRRA